jgi:hypothetical protein
MMAVMQLLRDKICLRSSILTALSWPEINLSTSDSRLLRRPAAKLCCSCQMGWKLMNAVYRSGLHTSIYYEFRRQTLMHHEDGIT